MTDGHIISIGVMYGVQLFVFLWFLRRGLQIIEKRFDKLEDNKKNS